MVAVWCPHCGLLHHHGEGPGRLFFHRVAHCVHAADGEDASPYRASGYFVIPTGRPLPRGAHAAVELLREEHPGTPRPLPGAWARPLSYTEAVGRIGDWYLQAGYSDEEITGALAEFAWMYERTAGRYRARSERSLL
ncbi:hypothetical protein RJ40_00795 [Methanofollis aquaemaris]|uniref:Uncharacterized protein n=1 Tax=Methanofollis aquaemaris TaxID=126734 RepID=A0A8A3S2K7_9EURY|nr:hypothetical protein [Methanofollis aquaemaris]QSZ66139.1 hypothetical protein RJ40_00795 [Methanofollis aquaemaris]